MMSARARPWVARTRCGTISLPRDTMRCLAALVVLFLSTAACSDLPEPPQLVGMTRTLGSWSGRGPRTLGFSSESGRLHVTWQTRNLDEAIDGTFRLTLHSGVSGRALRVLAEHHGAGHARIDIEEDPRPFTLMVDAEGVEWRVSVDETVAVAVTR